MAREGETMETRFIKINQVKGAFEKARKEKEERNTRINILENKKANLEESLIIAGVNENFAEYEKLLGEIKDVDIKIQVLNVANEKKGDVFIDVATVKNAWADYEAYRSRELERAIDQMEKITKELYIAFKRVVELQNEGINTRNECAVISGLKPWVEYKLDHTDLSKLEKLFPMKYAEVVTKNLLAGTNLPAEARLFINKGIIPSDVDSIAKLCALFNSSTPIMTAFLK